jgi:hypothetical protein
MPATPGVTLSGVIKDTSGNPVAGTVTAVLCNFAPNPPIVMGSYEIAPVQSSANANAGGAWSLSLFGGDQINPTGTFYQITIMPAGSNVPSWQAEYIINSGSLLGGKRYGNSPLRRQAILSSHPLARSRNRGRHEARMYLASL